MANKVGRVKTSASEDQIISAVVSAWPRVFGKRATLSQAGKTWAQIALETGHGNYIFNNNVGNITWSNDYPGSYYETRDSTTIGNDPANRKYYTAKMRSYSSLEDGIVDYLNFLKKRGSVARALRSGNINDFSSALASVNYYDPKIENDYVNKEGKKVPGYTSGLTSIYNKFVQDHKNKSSKIKPSQKSRQQVNDNGMVANFLGKINKFLDSFASSSESRISKYGSDYPNNKYIISINSNTDFSSKLEYSRILSLALKEELDADSEIYTDGKNVELQCILASEKNRGSEVLKEFCNAISNIFNETTKLKIASFISENENTHYQKLNIKISDINYRKFRLKIIKGSK